ncbi:hypothetical protein MAMT_02286 [Methylacidimicrobium tartarophylax]|uniref:Uncharacterized protein n=1 Tax=Methylacidimicrobium tartarophylax TaxID=1041768 RepID=A0A5E6MGT9_9BACT|nr:hypothetical protein MAMT_02286 [Methylacidimicrobium tartarophylax]
MEQFWVDQGVTQHERAYANGIGDGDTAEVSDLLSQPKLRVVSSTRSTGSCTAWSWLRRGCTARFGNGLGRDSCETFSIYSMTAVFYLVWGFHEPVPGLCTISAAHLIAVSGRLDLLRHDLDQDLIMLRTESLPAAKEDGS